MCKINAFLILLIISPQMILSSFMRLKSTPNTTRLNSYSLKYLTRRAFPFLFNSSRATVKVVISSDDDQIFSDSDINSIIAVDSVLNLVSSSASFIQPSLQKQSSHTEIDNNLQIAVPRILFLELPDDIIEYILDFNYLEYNDIRLTCKILRNIYDAVMFKSAWQIFPHAGPQTFEIRICKKYLLINLASNLISFKNSMLDIDHSNFFEKFNLIIGKRSFTELSFKNREHFALIRQISKTLIDLILVKNNSEALKMISALLKLNLIIWSDVSDLFIQNSTLFENAWSLGLLTITKVLAKNQKILFIFYVGHEKKGLATAIINGKHALAKFMATELIRTNHLSFPNSTGYLNCIIKLLITAEFWDILTKFYMHFSNFDFKIHLNQIAKEGKVAALKIFEREAKRNPLNLGHVAASHGHLSFLQKLDEMDLLIRSCGINEFGETAVHTAAFRGQTECLSYLLTKLQSVRGLDYLNIVEFSGLMPFHMAAQSGNSETLLEIIQWNPSYRPHGWNNILKETISPLQVAISCNQVEIVKVLLQKYPELINFRDGNKNTIIHLAVCDSGREMLLLLLNYASPYMIKSQNRSGNTALHLAALNGQFFQTEILFSTNLYTGNERNREGLTPLQEAHRKFYNQNISIDMHNYLDFLEEMTLFISRRV